MFKQKDCLAQDSAKKMKHCSLQKNLGGRLIWICLMECLDYVGCIGEVFRWFPACGIGGVVKPLPFDEIQQTQPLMMAIKTAVKDLIDFPLIRVIQLNWWRWIDHSTGDLTRASELQQ